MLLLAYLLRTDMDWRNAEIHLKLVVPEETAAQTTQANVDSLIQNLRIGASSQVLVSQGRPFYDILHESSQDADLIFLGIRTPGEDFTEYYQDLQSKTVGLPSTVFVLAAPGFSYGEVLSDS